MEVIQKVTELCDYILTITHKSPKEFRFSLVAKLHNYSLSILENLFRANDIHLSSEENWKTRKQYQQNALTDIRLLGYMAGLAKNHNCILIKQYNHICGLLYEARNMLSAWVKSDTHRVKNELNILNEDTCTKRD